MSELEEKIWNDILGLVKDHRKIDKEYIKKEGGVPPNVMIFRYCHKCNEIKSDLGIFRADMDDIRRLFKLIVVKAMTTPMICDVCATFLLPIRYSWNSESWMLKSKPEEADEVKEYYKVVGGIGGHPNRIESYISCVVTHLDKRILYYSEIHREGTKVTVEDSDKEVEEPGSGVFMINLPRIHVTKEGISFGDKS